MAFVAFYVCFSDHIPVTFEHTNYHIWPWKWRKMKREIWFLGICLLCMKNVGHFTDAIWNSFPQVANLKINEFWNFLHNGVRKYILWSAHVSNCLHAFCSVNWSIHLWRICVGAYLSIWVADTHISEKALCLKLIRRETMKCSNYPWGDNWQKYLSLWCALDIHSTWTQTFGCL